MTRKATTHTTPYPHVRSRCLHLHANAINTAMHYKSENKSNFPSWDHSVSV